MPANYTVEKVSGPEPWTHKPTGSVNHDFKLRLTGYEHPVVLTQKPTTPVPQVGQTISLEIVGDHPIHAGFKKVTKGEQQQFTANGVQTLGGGGSLGDFRPGTQSAVKSAVAYAACFSQPPSADEVILVAKQFFAAMEEMERGS